MGRRKERRLATKIASGRRVKLDLFEEPSGELGDNIAEEEAGRNGDSKTDTKFPTSPSSSGKKPQNPLMLLGQYSDEDLDEDSSDGHNDATVGDASLDIDDDAKKSPDREIEDGKNNVDDVAKEIVELLQMDKDFSSSVHPQKLEKEGICANDSDDLPRGTKTVEGITYPSVPNLQLVADKSGWKMVLHEESNQYYYWNVTTGETSWEVPDVLSLETDAASVERTIGDTAEEEDIKSDFALREEGECFDDDDINRDANQHQEASLLADAPRIDGAEVEVGHFGENRIGVDLCSQLLMHGERMLEILKSLKSSSCNVEDQNLKSRYTLEIDIRLADIKALASHGSSLLPYWLHSEGQLKQLEGVIDDLMKRYGSASTNGFEAKLEPQEYTGDDIKMDSSRQKPLFPVVESYSRKYTVNESNVDASCNGDSSTDYVPSVRFKSISSPADVRGETEATGIETKEFTQKPDLHPMEEVDMDVDMEVEDTLASVSGVHNPVSSDFSNMQNSVTNQEGGPLPMEEWVPPLPPDDEPFPPPPPDDEPFPPLPPDEPPGTSYHPASQSEFVLPFPYTAHYNMLYPGSGVEYYGQTNPEVSGTTLYTQAEGGQAAVSHLPHYYGTLSSVYAVAPLAVNPLDPGAYYSHQNGTLNHVPLISSSVTPSEPLPQNPAGSSDSNTEAGSSMLPNTSQDNNRLAISPDVPDRTPATSSVTNNVSVSLISETASVAPGLVAAAAATSKVQSKARSKKRAAAVVTTLRSNKKVSSLVDKWRAAKEELHEEEEEEPEDAYEALEKKRQREIEEWRAQQIASGEAKENANFQPIVGDWRERVKRKRAQKMKETEQSTADAGTDKIKQKKKPDLVELSKGLPSEWQVYWDDSTEQVYYGNVKTSETSWTRP